MHRCGDPDDGIGGDASAGDCGRYPSLVSADLAISFKSGEEVSFAIAPQSYLSDWRTIAEMNGWDQVRLFCDNSLQIVDRPPILELIEQLEALCLLLQTGEPQRIPEARRVAMAERIEPALALIDDAASRWDDVVVLSIG